MHTKKLVAIVCLEGCGEGEAIRQALEQFGYLVVMYKIGRPQHFIDILAGKMTVSFDFIILSCHGVEGEHNGEILMTELCEDVYFPTEPRGNFGFKEIDKYLALKNTCIINIGCSTGNDIMAKAFAKNNNIYIAPIDDINGGFIFVALFFYYLNSDIDIETAYYKASSLDAETGLFALRK